MAISGREIKEILDGLERLKSTFTLAVAQNSE